VITATSGAVMLGAFLAMAVIAWIVSRGAALNFWAMVNAGEIAAWQAKWIALPAAIAVLWTGSRVTRNIRRAPQRFAGLRLARAGFLAAVVATLLVATLVGITVPERLRRRQWGLEAAANVPGYTLSRAMLEYRELHGTLPPQENLISELRTLPDQNGAIAEALRFVDANGYEATSILAAAATKNKTLPRGGAIRKASLTTTADPPAVSFTNYKLRLPGSDKKLNTDDDLIVEDGLVMTLPQFRDYVASRSSAP
jgi:hypothetical protein